MKPALLGRLGKMKDTILERISEGVWSKDSHRFMELHGVKPILSTKLPFVQIVLGVIFVPPSNVFIQSTFSIIGKFKPNVAICVYLHEFLQFKYNHICLYK